jgi:hypothetical protein
MGGPPLFAMGDAPFFRRGGAPFICHRWHAISTCDPPCEQGLAAVVVVGLLLLFGPW